MHSQPEFQNLCLNNNRKKQLVTTSHVCLLWEQKLLYREVTGSNKSYMRIWVWVCLNSPNLTFPLHLPQVSHIFNDNPLQWLWVAAPLTPSQGETGNGTEAVPVWMIKQSFLRMPPSLLQQPPVLSFEISSRGERKKKEHELCSSCYAFHFSLKQLFSFSSYYTQGILFQRKGNEDKH